MIEDWKPRKRGKRIPYGYMVDESEGGDPNLLVPDPALIPLIDEALDQLDAGISLREVAEWFNSRAEKPLSHAGFKIIWDTVRPDHPRKQLIKSPKKTRMTREERSLYIKKNKLKKEKITLAAVQKRIEKRSEEIGIFKKEIEVDSSPLVEFPSTTYDYESIPEDENIIFRPSPGPQERFLAASEQEVLYGGAAGGGKSFAMLADPMRYFDNPYFNGLLLRRTNDELRKLISESHMLYKGAYPDARWSDKKSLWTFPSGAQFWLTYLERDEDVMRYQGQEFSWIGIDELTQYATPASWIYLSSRLRVSKNSGLPTYMRATTNPGGPGHGWVKRMFIDPAPPGVAFDARDIETGQVMTVPVGDPDFPEELWGKPLFQRKFIPAKLSDNKYLDYRYKANLLSLKENQRRQLLDGDWSIVEGAAFDEFRTHIHTCEPFEIPEHWMRFRSCDYGYSERQASAVHWYAVDPTYGTLYVYRELYVNQLTGTELARKILEMERGDRISYGVLDSSVWARRGQTGPSIAEEMIQAGCRWRESDRSPGSRIASKNRLHELLRIDPVNGKPGIIFFDTCRQIIADLPMIPQDKDSDDIDPKYASDHAYDSIRYGIQTRPNPKSPWETHGKTTTSYRPAHSVFGY